MAKERDERDSLDWKLEDATTALSELTERLRRKRDEASDLGRVPKILRMAGVRNDVLASLSRVENALQGLHSLAFNISREEFLHVLDKETLCEYLSVALDKIGV